MLQIKCNWTCGSLSQYFCVFPLLLLFCEARARTHYNHAFGLCFFLSLCVCVYLFEYSIYLFIESNNEMISERHRFSSTRYTKNIYIYIINANCNYVLFFLSLSFLLSFDVFVCIWAQKRLHSSIKRYIHRQWTTTTTVTNH